MINEYNKAICQSLQGLTVRKILKTDKTGILDLINVLSSTDRLEYSITDEWFNYAVENVSNCIFVALCNDVLIALACCMVDTASGIGDINIIVNPDYRRKGVGSLLYANTVQAVSDIKLEALEGFAMKRLQDSVAFAENKGFSQICLSWEMEMNLDGKSQLMVVEAGLNFRKAELPDWNAYTEIISAAFGYQCDQNSFNILFEDPSIEVYLLYKSDVAIGTATIQIRKNNSTGYIYDIAILQAHRRKGMGSLLINHCISRLSDLEIRKAILVVDGTNEDAIKLYKSQGFKVVDIGINFQKILKR